MDKALIYSKAFSFTVPSIQMNKTTEKVGTIHCTVLISKQEARKLITVIALEI